MAVVDVLDGTGYHSVDEKAKSIFAHDDVISLSPIVNSAYEDAKKLAVTLGGSGKRLQALRKPQDCTQQKYLKPKLPQHAGIM